MQNLTIEKKSFISLEVDLSKFVSRETPAQLLAYRRMKVFFVVRCKGSLGR